MSSPSSSNLYFVPQSASPSIPRLVMSHTPGDGPGVRYFPYDPHLSRPVASSHDASVSISTYIERTYLRLRAEEITTSRGLRIARIEMLATRHHAAEIRRKALEQSFANVSKELETVKTKNAEHRARVSAGLLHGAKHNKRLDDLTRKVGQTQKEFDNLCQEVQKVMEEETEAGLELNALQEEVIRTERDMETLNKLVERRMSDDPYGAQMSDGGSSRS